ncbi:hypothetical protein K474DRAFT_1677218 [Panus rudis PR-1116 ss-1]|nr:hypothetical protein K474DRAFT_1677218 [Panus rudis PR-1116 ss-1]
MSDSSDQEIPLGFTEADYYRFYLENYCILATSVLLFYDVLLTIPTELQRIWSRKFSGATLVYLLTRYALFCDRVVLTASLFLRITSDTNMFYMISVSLRSEVPQATSTPFAFGRPILGCGRFINTDDKTDFACNYYQLHIPGFHPLAPGPYTYQLYLLWDVWLEFSQVVTAIACYRFILNLCDTNTPQDAPLCLRRWSHPRIVGNMGSPLEILDPFGDPGRRVEKEEEEYIPLQDIVGNVRF